MAHYYARHFFSDVAVSAYMEDNDEVKVHAISDLTHDLDSVTLEVKVITWKSQVPLQTVLVDCQVVRDLYI